MLGKHQKKRGDSLHYNHDILDASFKLLWRNWSRSQPHQGGFTSEGADPRVLCVIASNNLWLAKKTKAQSFAWSRLSNDCLSQSSSHSPAISPPSLRENRRTF